MLRLAQLGFASRQLQFVSVISDEQRPASAAPQVYRARVRATGQEVAVKVQRPAALATISKVRGGCVLRVCFEGVFPSSASGTNRSLRHAATPPLTSSLTSPSPRPLPTPPTHPPTPHLPTLL